MYTYPCTSLAAKTFDQHIKNTLVNKKIENICYALIKRNNFYSLSSKY